MNEATTRRKARYTRREQSRHTARHRVQLEIGRLERKLVLPLERMVALEPLELYDLVVDIWRVRCYPVPWAVGREEIWARWAEPGDEERLASVTPAPAAERPMTAAERQRRHRERRAVERETDARCRPWIARLEILFGCPFDSMFGADVLHLASGLVSPACSGLTLEEMKRRTDLVEEPLKAAAANTRALKESMAILEEDRQHCTPFKVLSCPVSIARAFGRRLDVKPAWDIEPWTGKVLSRLRDGTGSIVPVTRPTPPPAAEVPLAANDVDVVRGHLMMSGCADSAGSVRDDLAPREFRAS